MEKRTFFSYSSLFVISLFWIAVFALFLYTPAAIRYLYPERSLTIFTWPAILDPHYLRKFEQETGIKLYISYYESNQEMFSKVHATGGTGYDIILPSDYTVELLIKDGLLQKLDHAKLPFFSELNHNLLDKYFDPGNHYSLPYLWGMYGIAINWNYFKDTPLGTINWKTIFEQNPYGVKIGMTDESREAILLASFYLFKTIDIANDPQKIEQVKELLIKQKQWVEAYTESRSEYLLLSESAPLAVAFSPDIYKVKKEHPYLDIKIPEEGSFVLIDSIVIPKATDKTDMIYQFINFLYREDVLTHHSEKFGFCSPMYSSKNHMPEDFCPTDEQFAKLRFFENVLPQDLVNEIWVAVMSR